MPGIILERCCINALQVIEAVEGGAARVELCKNLSVGGVTPDETEIVDAVATGLPVNVLIRPRGGDFVYSESEILEMEKSIIFCTEAGVSGVVIGALDISGNVDMDAMRFLMSASGGMSVTFHRAFDECRDPFRSLEDIISLKCDRILTSGQSATAFEGASLIAELIRKAKGRIIIMPGAGISPENVDFLAHKTGAVEFHGTRLGVKQTDC